MGAGSVYRVSSGQGPSGFSEQSHLTVALLSGEGGLASRMDGAWGRLRWTLAADPGPVGGWQCGLSLTEDGPCLPGHRGGSWRWAPWHDRLQVQVQGWSTEAAPPSCGAEPPLWLGTATSRPPPGAGETGPAGRQCPSRLCRVRAVPASLRTAVFRGHVV